MTKKGSQKTPDAKGSPRLAFPKDEVRLPWLSLLLEAYAVIDQGISIALSRAKRIQGKRPACVEKCDVCCRANTDIPVFPLELAGITWYAVEKMGSPLRDVLKQHLLSHDAQPPCPFLVDNICSIYPVRPAACRQYVVFGRPCTNGEDPYYTRRKDVLTPLEEFMNQAIYLMLPFYGISKEPDRTNAVRKRLLHTRVQNIYSCNWKTLQEKMERFDAVQMTADTHGRSEAAESV